MSTNVSAPPKYLERPGEPAASFKVWLGLFNNYMHITNRNRKADDRLTEEDRNHYIFSFLGVEGARIFSSHPVAFRQADTSHEDYVKAVKDLFDKPVNSVRAHVDFFRRYQEKDETSAEYLAALRSLAADCSFDDKEEKFLAIQLVNGCRSETNRLKLLEHREPELQKVFESMQAAESASATVDHLNGDKGGAIKTLKKRKPPSAPLKEGKSGQGQGSSKGVRCYGCGNEGHRIKDPKCPAVELACSHCGNVGHLAKCCRKKQRGDPPQNPPKSQSAIRVSSVTDRKFYLDIELSSIQTSTPVPITMMLDTGSDVTAITKIDYDKNFSNIPLSQVNEEVQGYDGSTIQCFGRFTATATHDKTSVQCDVYILPKGCQPVLGVREFRSLGLLPRMAKSVAQIRSEGRQTEFLELLKNFPNLTEPGIGTFPGYKHKILLRSEARPVACKLRSIPIAYREMAIKDIWKLAEEGVWEPVQKSEWIHPLVAVPKPNNPDEIRITSDFTRINEYVIPDRFPLPHIKDLYLKAKGCTHYTILDLRKAYHSIELDEESSQLTTTITPVGLFRYKRLVMGLTDAGSVFQRKVHETIGDLPYCVGYVDDILVFGTEENHHERVREVLRRLSEKNFRLTPSKCKYGISEVTYLGFKLNKDGISPDSEKVAPINEFPAPSSVSELQRFIGMINRYADFIPNLSTILQPLRLLLRDGVPFKWELKQQKAFENAKTQLANATVNAIFDPNAETFVTTDASKFGLGAVLSQVQNGTEVPIEFASHALKEHETRYAANELEAYGCVWACEHWSKYLLGINFTLRTDHSALKSLLTTYGTKYKQNKFHRWVDRLAVFQYSVEYRKGSLNEVADALSRAPKNTGKVAIDDKVHVSMIQRVTQAGITMERIRVATANDNDLLDVESYATSAWPAKSKIPSRLHAYYAVRDEITVEDGYLTRNHERIILPSCLVKDVLDMAHAGHPGICRMKAALRDKYWWPNMNHDVEVKVKFCDRCQMSDKSAGTNPKSHMSQPEARHPWDIVSIDISGPFWTAPASKSYAVVLLDHYTSYPEVLLTQNTESAKIIQWLQEIFARYLYPNHLISDNGPQFVSDSFEDFLKQAGIKHLRTPVYNPQGNGRVEVFNRSLKHAVQAFSEHKSYEQQINEFLMAYRSTSVTGKPPPGELFLGRPIRRQYEPFDAMKVNRQDYDTVDLKKEPPVQANRGPFRVGDKVLVKRVQPRKGQSPWSEPLEVVKVLGSYTYKLSNDQVWNARKMRRYFQPELVDEQVVESGDGANLNRRSQRTTKGKPPMRFGQK